MEGNPIKSLIKNISIFLLSASLLIHSTSAISVAKDEELSNKLNIAKQETQLTTGKVKVAILDTQIDTDNTSLNEFLLASEHIIPPSSSPLVSNSHGTRVALILANILDTLYGKSLTGKLEILPIVVLNQNSVGSENDLANGILKAVDEKANVIIMALGTYNSNKLLEEAVAYAEKNQVVIVAAAGNNGGEIHYPASYATVLSVGAVNNDFSINKSANSGSSLDVVGMWEVTTAIQNQDVNYTSYGTSMAAAQVGALVAAIILKFGYTEPDIIRSQVRYSSRYNQNEYSSSMGFGIIDFERALDSSEDYIKSSFEPNNSIIDAKSLSFEKRITSELGKDDTNDWYKIFVEENSQAYIDVIVPPNNDDNISMTINDQISVPLNGSQLQRIACNLNKGLNFVNFKSIEEKNIQYSFSITLKENIDIAEENNNVESAYELSPSDDFIGTFSDSNDVDYYKIKWNNNIPPFSKLLSIVYSKSNKIHTETDIIFEPHIIDPKKFEGNEVAVTSFKHDIIIKIKNKLGNTGSYTLHTRVLEPGQYAFFNPLKFVRIDMLHFNSNEQVYLPLRTIIESIGGKVTWDHQKKHAQIFIKGKRHIVGNQSKAVVINVKNKDNEYNSAIIVKGKIVVPKEMITDLFHIQTIIDEKGFIVHISGGDTNGQQKVD
ncbi:hypothetical protein PAECIP111893_04138 [Paenibacillus plantiphilus]|uniref:Peptidase S8/S53 domain-containing protein n=1 Tax=Paenibacillus plantiphilus TaxID=2905650 RepID=A0ABN8GS11_9BACL|nr:S8 family serine peptidase [Paenibacillus plantiphilus]CAH1216492.1 hypothetical protein PAECIP111893_04138 [Paenibacillus plantiphilus]